MSSKILVFGSSGSVGLDFINVNKNKNILYYSKKTPPYAPKKIMAVCWSKQKTLSNYDFITFVKVL